MREDGDEVDVAVQNKENLSRAKLSCRKIGRDISYYLRGRCRFERPEASWANSEGEWERADDRMASRIFCSSFLAIISAALPRGARMIGT